MGIMDRFTLPSKEQEHADPSWFDARMKWRSEKNGLLREWLSEEVGVLKAFHDGDMSVDEAAHAITRPISLSSVPPVGGYSDDCLALNDLWVICIAALVEWPTTYTPKLFALLDAIATIPDKVHKGEATDDEGEQLTWSKLPYFNMALYNANGSQPGEICQQINPAARLSARLLYLRLQDIEAQCFAKRIVSWKNRMMEPVVRALEKEQDTSDTQSTPTQAQAYHQVVLDFYLPAISLWFKYNGLEIYRLAVRDYKDWSAHPADARLFGDGNERWSYWKKRLHELVEHEDNCVNTAAKEILGYMTAAERGTQA